MIDTNKVIASIYSSYEAREKEAKKRTHLGASVIGDKCKRHLFYEFRWYSKGDMHGRILRLFNTGKREEERVLKDLGDLGFVFESTDDGQIEFKDSSGHIGGSVDAVIAHAPDFGITGRCILEIKTHSEKNFKKFQKEKVMTAFPKHYHQMQYYMGSMHISHALYVAVNKNTDEIYMELIEFDNFAFIYLKSKAESIIVAESAPERLSENPSWFECKMCKFHSICHTDVPPAVNCRTCKHSVPVQGGSWGCKLHNKPLSYEDQIAGCDSYEPNN